MTQDPPTPIDSTADEGQVRARRLSRMASTAALCGRFDQAIDLLEQAEALGMTGPDLHNRKGVAQMRLGRGVEAETSFRTALDLDPTHLDAANNLGALLKERNQWEEAAAVFGKTLEDTGEMGRPAKIARARLEECETNEGRFVAAFRRPTRIPFLRALNDRRAEASSEFLVRLVLFAAAAALPAAGAVLLCARTFLSKIDRSPASNLAIAGWMALIEETAKFSLFFLLIRRGNRIKTVLDGPLFGIVISLPLSVLSKIFIFWSAPSIPPSLVLSSPLLLASGLLCGVAAGFGSFERPRRIPWMTLGLGSAVLFHALHAWVCLTFPVAGAAVWSAALLIALGLIARRSMNAGFYSPAGAAAEAPVSQTGEEDDSRPAIPEAVLPSLRKKAPRPLGPAASALAVLFALAAPPFGALVGLALLFGPNRRARPFGLNILTLAALLCAVWLFAASRFAVVRQPDDGMAPFLHKGALVLTVKTRGGRPPLPDDLAVVRNPERPEFVSIKRVLAVGPARVEIGKSFVAVNGKTVWKTFDPSLSGLYETPKGFFLAVNETGDGAVRDDALSPIPLHHVLGRPAAVLFPWRALD